MHIKFFIKGVIRERDRKRDKEREREQGEEQEEEETEEEDIRKKKRKKKNREERERTTRAREKEKTREREGCLCKRPVFSWLQDHLRKSFLLFSEVDTESLSSALIVFENAVLKNEG